MELILQSMHNKEISCLWIKLFMENVLVAYYGFHCQG